MAPAALAVASPFIVRFLGNGLALLLTLASVGVVAEPGGQSGTESTMGRGAARPATLDCADWDAGTFFEAAGPRDVAACLDVGVDLHHGLRQAVAHADDPATVQALVDAGANPNVAGTVAGYDPEGHHYPLHLALIWGRSPAVIRILLDAGADALARKHAVTACRLCGSAVQMVPIANGCPMDAVASTRSIDCAESAERQALGGGSIHAPADPVVLGGIIVRGLKHLWRSIEDLLPAPRQKPEPNGGKDRTDIEPPPESSPPSGGSSAEHPMPVGDALDQTTPSRAWQVAHELGVMLAKEVAKSGTKDAAKKMNSDGADALQTCGDDSECVRRRLWTDPPTNDLLTDALVTIASGVGGVSHMAEREFDNVERLGSSGQWETFKDATYEYRLATFAKRLARDCLPLVADLKPANPNALLAPLSTSAEACAQDAFHEQQLAFSRARLHAKMRYSVSSVARVHTAISHRRSLYCGCEYDSEESAGGAGGSACPAPASAAGPSFKVGNERSVVWARVIPAAWMGATRSCWNQGHELCGAVRVGKGEECCLTPGVDAPLRSALTDPHNTFPTALGVQRARAGMRFGIVGDQIPSTFGDCAIRVGLDRTVVQVPVSVRGDVARAALYMLDRHGIDVRIRRAELIAWALNDPPEAWELERASRIAQTTGVVNPYVVETPGFH